MDKTNTLIVLEYVLDSELTDYLVFCEENGLENNNYKSNLDHIFAHAALAYENETGVRYEI